jgi:hypothetical protein
VAVNCTVAPAAIEGFAGVTAIDTSTGGPTVSVVEPCTSAEVAVIVVLPITSASDSPPAVIVATAGAEELHVAEEVKFWVLPSPYVPVAVNCTDNPAGSVPLAGITAIETRVGEPAVTNVDPQIAPVQALTVAEPAAAA